MSPNSPRRAQFGQFDRLCGVGHSLVQFLGRGHNRDSWMSQSQAVGRPDQAPQDVDHLLSGWSDRHSRIRQKKRSLIAWDFHQHDLTDRPPRAEAAVTIKDGLHQIRSRDLPFHQERSSRMDLRDSCLRRFFGGNNAERFQVDTNLGRQLFDRPHVPGDSRLNPAPAVCLGERLQHCRIGPTGRHDRDGSGESIRPCEQLVKGLKWHGPRIVSRPIRE